MIARRVQQRVGELGQQPLAHAGERRRGSVGEVDHLREGVLDVIEEHAAKPRAFKILEVPGFA